MKRGRHARPRSVSLWRSLLYFVPSYALAIGGYLAVNVIAARILNTSDFGYFVVVVTVTILIGQLSLLGVHRSGVREAASAESPEILGDLRRGVRAVMLIPVPLTAAATAYCVWFLRGSEASDIPTAILSGVLVLGAAYQKLTANFLRGLGHVHAATMVTGRSGGVLVALVQAGCMLLVAVFDPDLGLPGVLACTAVGYLLPVVWAWWLLRSSWPHIPGRDGILQDLKRVFHRDWRFSLSQTGGFLNSNVELWLAGAVLSAGGTSLFASGQRLSNLLLMPSTSLGTVFSPALARLAKKDEDGLFEPLVRTASTVATVSSGVLWVPMVLAPGLSLTIVFGADFAPAATALMLLSTGFLLNSVSGLSATTLSMAHHEGDVALINWCAVAVRIVAGVVCARAWGVNGLAASSAVIAAAVYTASWYYVRRRLALSTHATLRPRLSLLRRIPG